MTQLDAGVRSAGFAEAAEVRSKIESSATQRSLSDVFAGLLAHGQPCPDLRLLRVKCKPGKLTVTYGVTVGGGNARPVTVTWLDPDTGSVPLDQLDSVNEHEAIDRGVAAPFRRLCTFVPELGLRVQVSPYDPAFPQLVRLVDPGHVGPMLNARLGGSHLSPEIESIRYRPGQRHVLRYDLRDGAGAAVFAKLHRGDGAQAAATAGAVGELLRRASVGVNAFPPLDSIDEDGVVLTAERPGPPLSELLCRPVSIGPHLRRAGAALRVLHEGPARLAEGLRSRHLGAEVQTTRRASALIGRFLPTVGVRVDTVLERIEGHLCHEPEGPTFVHGDYKADHLIVERGGLSLIDFDSCALAEPALDLGKFLADIRYWFATVDRPSVKDSQRDFLAGYSDGGADATVALDRIRCYEALFLVRAAGRRVQVSAADWESRTSALVADAAAVLGEVVA